MTTRITRGEIYFANLGSAVGSEQDGFRPVLVVQNNIGNAHSPTIVVAPLTSSKKAFLPTHVRIARTGLLTTDSIALCEQLRTLDRKRLDSYIGRIEPKEQRAVDHALAVSLELSSQPKTLDFTLCQSCKANFEYADYTLVKRGFMEHKEACDLCRVGMGYEYGVFARKAG